MTNDDFKNLYLGKAEAAALFPGNVSVRTLDRWHAKKIGPPRVRIGNTVLYRRDLVAEFIDNKIKEDVHRQQATQRSDMHKVKERELMDIQERLERLESAEAE